MVTPDVICTKGFLLLSEVSDIIYCDVVEVLTFSDYNTYFIITHIIV